MEVEIDTIMFDVQLDFTSVRKPTVPGIRLFTHVAHTLDITNPTTSFQIDVVTTESDIVRFKGFVLDDPSVITAFLNHIHRFLQICERNAVLRRQESAHLKDSFTAAMVTRKSQNHSVWS